MKIFEFLSFGREKKVFSERRKFVGVQKTLGKNREQWLQKTIFVQLWSEMFTEIRIWRKKDNFLRINVHQSDEFFDTFYPLKKKSLEFEWERNRWHSD